MIVIRPGVDQRQVLEQCKFSFQNGAEGDEWARSCSKRTSDGGPHPNVQVVLMNSRSIDLIAAGQRDRWPLAGDNLFVDLDLSQDNIQHGQQLAAGGAILEVTEIPHNGCKKFALRYGQAALDFVNSPLGKQLHLRGIYARVIQDGVIRTGDSIKKL